MGTIDGLDAVRGKCIVLGVCASIAAYKAVDISSQLVKWGADVRVVMTPDAVKLIPALTLQTLSAILWLSICGMSLRIGKRAH